MVVVIGGMHRSGTSVTAKLLRSRGLYLGRDEDLLPPVDYNSDGLPVGVEMTAPQAVSLERINELLASLGQPPLADHEFKPVKAA